MLANPLDDKKFTLTAYKSLPFHENQHEDKTANWASYF